MNIQTINNKHYTELDVIILPTNEASNIGKVIKKMSNREIGQLDYFNSSMLQSLEYYEPQYLYFLSNEKIKKNDYFYSEFKGEKRILKFNKLVVPFPNDKKVEATTDRKLILKPYDTRFKSVTLNRKSCDEVVPQIPQQFIKHFINEFNKLDSFSAKGNIITKVKVRIDLHDNDISCDKWKIMTNNNEVIPLIDVLENTPFHKPDFSHLKVQTAVDWLIKQLVNKQNGEITTLSHLSLDQIFNQAKVIEQQQIENAFDMGISSVIKNYDMVCSDTDGEDYYKSKFKQ